MALPRSSRMHAQSSWLIQDQEVFGLGDNPHWGFCRGGRLFQSSLRLGEAGVRSLHSIAEPEPEIRLGHRFITDPDCARGDQLLNLPPREGGVEIGQELI